MYRILSNVLGMLKNDICFGEDAHTSGYIHETVNLFCLSKKCRTGVGGWAHPNGAVACLGSGVEGPWLGLFCQTVFAL